MPAESCQQVSQGKRILQVFMSEWDLIAEEANKFFVASPYFRSTCLSEASCGAKIRSERRKFYSLLRRPGTFMRLPRQVSPSSLPHRRTHDKLIMIIE